MERDNLMKIVHTIIRVANLDESVKFFFVTNPDGLDIQFI